MRPTLKSQINGLRDEIYNLKNQIKDLNCDVSKAEIDELKKSVDEIKTALSKPIMKSEEQSVNVTNDALMIGVTKEQGVIVNCNNKQLYQMGDNVRGKLCQFVSTIDGFVSPVGKFVEYIGDVTVIDGVIVPRVQLTTGLSSMVCGVVERVITGSCAVGNRTITLGDGVQFVSVIDNGVVGLEGFEGEIKLGALLGASKDGNAQLLANDKAVQFCLAKKIPIAKVIALYHEKLVAHVC